MLCRELTRIERSRYPFFMNKLAVELNETLKGSVAFDLLSDFGKRIFFPKGIVAQSTEAKKLGGKLNATIGMACHKGEPIILPSVHTFLDKLSPAEAVGYAGTAGEQRIRDLWKHEIVRKNPALTEDSISDPIVVPGLSAGIWLTADMFINPGDTVIFPDMYWDNYPLIMEERKEASVVTFPFYTSSGGFNVTRFAETVRSCEKTKKVVILLNFPNNPTGYSPTTAEAQAIAAEIKKCAEEGYKILVIIDDAYFGLFFEPETYKSSLFNLLAGIHKNVCAVKVDGSTKEDFVWGFRCAFITFGSAGMSKAQYDALVTKMMGAVRSSVSSSSMPAQSILFRAFQNPNFQSEKAHYTELVKRRYEAVKRLLKNRTDGKALKELPFNSGYFMTFACTGIHAETLRKELLKAGVGTISIGDAYLRVAFASVDEDGIEELYRLIFETADRLLQA